MLPVSIPKISRIAARVGLFIFSEFYLLSPLPGKVIDAGYIQSCRIASFIYEYTKVDFGPYPYPDLQDDIFVLLLETTSLLFTLIFMLLVEISFNFLWRKIKKNDQAKPTT